MPVTLMDRVPLPNLKVYSAGSVVLLAVAVYHAVSVTSDPAWRANATLAQLEVAAPEPAPAPPPPPPDTRNTTEQLVDVLTFMMQEPLCMWTLINMCYCALAAAACGVQRAVFGALRVSEAQRLKDKLWNYVFYKFIFVFGVVNVQYMDEVVLWCAWFTLAGCLQLLAHLAADRFEYLSSSPRVASWAYARLVALVSGVATAGVAMAAVATAVGMAAGPHTFCFMAAECVLIVVSSWHVLARYLLLVYEADPAGPVAYYTHLAFDSACLCVEAAHVVQQVWAARLLVSAPALVLLLQLRALLARLQARWRRHRLLAALHSHMSHAYPMASKEEVEKNQDNCAICWEPMKEARKLPCAHLFHNSCLCQWVQQDASCPTCRRALHAAPPPAPPAPRAPHAPHPPPLPPALRLAPPHNNRLFHFDGSRYVSWLPSFSVEVTRLRAPPPDAAHIDAMTRQVQQVFPGYPAALLARDLAATRSADLTVHRILEGRLPAPPPPPHPPAAEAAPSPAAPAPAPPAPDVPRSVSAELDAASERSEGGFGREAAERERALQRRKQRLLAAARSRYLARTHPAPHAPSLSHPPPPPPPDS